jgi:hypothetical protein
MEILSVITLRKRNDNRLSHFDISVDHSDSCPLTCQCNIVLQSADCARWLTALELVSGNPTAWWLAYLASETRLEEKFSASKC